MSHYPEAHLSTLSNSIMRMSREELDAILKERDKVILKVRQSSCIEDRVRPINVSNND